MAEINVERAICKAVVAVIRKQPFYGHILCQLPRVYSETVNTFAVGRNPDSNLIKLFINPAYVERVYAKANEMAEEYRKAKHGNKIDLGLSQEPNAIALDHLSQILTHEILHIVFRHLFIQKSNAMAMNIAKELSVNSYIDRNMLLDKGIFPEDFNFPSKLGFDEYYKMLAKDQYGKKKGKESQSGNSKDQRGQGDGEGQGEGDGQNDRNGEQQGGNGKQDKDKSGNGNNGAQNADNGESKKKDENAQGGSDSMDNGGDGDGSADLGDYQSPTGGRQLDSHRMWNGMEDDEATKMLVKDIIRKSAQTVKEMGQWGSMPAGMAEDIDDFLTPKEASVPWQSVLRDFLASSSESVLSYTNKRISRRYGTRPGTRKEDVLNVAIGIDTSGSISHEELVAFFNELYWISKETADITVFEADTKINREYPFRLFDGEGITGRGGTDLEPVIKEASERKFDCLIYFTDCWAPKITTDYNIPVMFVCPDSYHFEREQLPYPATMVLYLKKEELLGRK